MQARARLLVTLRHSGTEVRIGLVTEQSSGFCGLSMSHLSQRQGACERGQGDDQGHGQVLDGGQALQHGRVQQRGGRRGCDDEAQRRRLLQGNAWELSAADCASSSIERGSARHFCLVRLFMRL